MENTRPPLPPFTAKSAVEQVRAAENGWNNKDPQKVSLAYTVDSQWRNRSSFVNGRDEIVEFLTEKWQKEIDYKLIKELWAFTENRIAVRYAYEYKNSEGQWFRAYGNENWEFDEFGLMKNRYACINDLAIEEKDRLFTWQGKIRPDDFPSLTELGL
ncbi:nuclear transport factor 2 family protein [Colwellia sp. 1_MG-2023]|uniref:nuclear transport factor 2 family protein n=1 Tax=unclassified Colwellia TaxID=196834 RepID=UPI001C07F50A|nr:MULTISPECIES: nuclear transport factor 2 family protein [unclassified Colwellia]MBU2923615.1 nuclear transport factor 2 family protein [Colwellia sp. C2M11]MDO6652286.1 nuclear transport factor 2 family protein [Colwellia sp. 3_MG-2023]MDO6664545.1 nuclear transport factor 2 family protein [Colwellia sp. 2_MG-2023]MDO6688896.1 nuclear transport factor 2 family protein [Colwellia sp. 1_MG-2023]